MPRAAANNASTRSELSMPIGIEDEDIVAAIRQRGLDISSVWDLVHARTPYPEAIPVLIERLSALRDRDTVEGVVRALTVKEARPAAGRALVEALKQRIGDTSPRAASLRWAIANALTVVATQDLAAELRALLANPGTGSARQMLAIALGNLKDSQGVPLLIGLLHDEEVVGHAVMALGELKAIEARASLSSLADHPRAWVRKEVAKALKKIDAAARRPGGNQ